MIGCAIFPLLLFFFGFQSNVEDFIYPTHATNLFVTTGTREGDLFSWFHLISIIKYKCMSSLKQLW
jgi:hypothetical protein